MHQYHTDEGDCEEETTAKERDTGHLGSVPQTGCPRDQKITPRQSQCSEGFLVTEGQHVGPPCAVSVELTILGIYWLGGFGELTEKEEE